MKPFLLIRVAPLGSCVVSETCNGVAREFHRYPQSPRGERLSLQLSRFGLSKQDAADALVLTTDELSDLEHGRSVLATDAEWDRAEQVLREAKRDPAVVVVSRLMIGGWVR